MGSWVGREYMARPVVRWATGVVGCSIGVAYGPIPLEMLCFASADLAMSPSSGYPCVR